MKLIVEPDDGIAPVLTAIKQAKKTIDVLIFRLDRAGIDGSHQQGRREAPASPRDAPARPGRHRFTLRTRSHPLSRQADDRGWPRAASLWLQLHDARYR